MPPDRLNRRSVAGWLLYDWANSAVPAIVLTFIFAPYFTQAVARNEILGTAQWGNALTVSALLVAVISPILGPVADKGGPRKPWIFAFSMLGVVTIAAMWFVRPVGDDVLLALTLVVLANFGFEMGIVFYNAMLPDLAPRSWLGRISGWGWGVGYAGGLVAMIVVLFGFVQVDTPPLGLSKESLEHVRIAAPIAALWFAVFVIPLFLWTRDEPHSGLSFRAALSAGMEEVRGTVATLRRHGQVARYLLAHMIYRDGLNTLFAFGSIYAAGTFGMPIEEVLMFGIGLNVAAGLGAFGFAWVDDLIGSRRTLLISLVAVTALAIPLLIVESKTAFWVFGVTLGIFFGPVQSASRTMMARLAPDGMESQMFGLFAMSGKITAFAGPFIVGWVTLLSGSQRIGMSTIIAFFVVGTALLWTVRPAPREAPAR